MFLRKTERRKNGKAHLYWSVVESRRLNDGRVAQRHLLYLGEINSSQAEAWRKAVEVFDEEAGQARAVQRSLQNVIEKIDLRPPKAAARRSCGIVLV